jgi:DNA-binding response OmpR family regulator
MRIADGYLRAAGFMTVLAFDGARALQAIAERQPDVVVLDLMMPSLNGFDVLMRLKDQPRRPRIVVLSARGREEDVTRAFDLGADDYVVKPFSPQELRARILRLLT